MLNNTYLRIAIIIVAVILLYYLVITLARSTAAADATQMPPAGSELREDAVPNLGTGVPR